MPPLAHVGHYALWFLYAAPVVIVLVAIGLSVARDRGEGDDDAPGPPDRHHA